jgi:hypothetical protein
VAIFYGLGVSPLAVEAFSDFFDFLGDIGDLVPEGRDFVREGSMVVHRDENRGIEERKLLELLDADELVREARLDSGLLCWGWRFSLEECFGSWEADPAVCDIEAGSAHDDFAALCERFEDFKGLVDVEYFGVAVEDDSDGCPDDEADLV